MGRGPVARERDLERADAVLTSGAGLLPLTGTHRGEERLDHRPVGVLGERRVPQPARATVTGADFKNVDVDSAKLIDLKGQAEAKDWSERVNADRAVTQASN